MEKVKKIFSSLHQRFISNRAIIAFVSLLWLVLRSGFNPKRVIYPCQRAAAANVSIFGIPLFSVFLAKIRRRRKWSLLRLFLGVSAAAVFLLVGGFSYQAYRQGRRQKRASELFLRSLEAAARAEIFVVQNVPLPSGDNHLGIEALTDLMGQQGTDFDNLIGSDDVVVIKINGQWERRGGTNTDVLKGLIYRIVNRPGGFNGEIVVADNTQYRGGDLNWSESNAEDHSQSALDVVNHFRPTHKVSTFSWRSIGGDQISIGDYVSEYEEGDDNDGYVCETVNEVSYPKFTTLDGTKISLKRGVWNGSSYENDRLKLINFPVLKLHGNFGATASLKNFAGFLSKACHQTVTPDFHSQIAAPEAILAREMVYGRMPDLHLLDAIWIGAKSGPSVAYGDATRADMLLASTDPLALDYYATKEILYPVSGRSQSNPDGSNIFNRYLTASRDYFNSHGYSFTMDGGEMDVYVYDFQGQPTLTPTPTSSAKDPDLNNDGLVNFQDMKQLLALWGSISSSAPEDLDSNGRVNALDAGIVVRSWTGGP